MRRLALLVLLCAPVAAASMESIKKGLSADSRGAREAAEEAARLLARRDPAGLAQLWTSLDGRGRRLLVRALASAGTRHAALVALKRAGDPNPEVFRALLDGLVRGGEKALFAELPDGLAESRREAITALRLRWKIEKELVRLKAPAGSTGHYTGQFNGFVPLGKGVISVFFDIVMDRAIPLLGEASAGPFRSIHPGMERYDRRELRDLVAHGFGEVAEKSDAGTIGRLKQLFKQYWELDQEEFDFERNSLAPALAYSLHDLGHTEAAEEYIRDLEAEAAGFGYDALRAQWSLGYANIRIGNHREGERYYERILSMRGSGISRHVAAYNLACNFAMRARQEPKRRKYFKERALDYLELAVHRLNWWDWGWMEADGDLDFIRKEPRYRKVLEHLKKKWPDRRSQKQSKNLREILGGGR